MIIDFSLKNYLSIKDEATLSFLSSNKSRLDDKLKLLKIEEGRYEIYAFSALYGPNASGKTNFIKGLGDFIQVILSSHRLDLDKPIPAYKPYLLDRKTRNEAVEFGMEFVTEGIRYNYSFGLLETEVLYEELYFYPEKRKAMLFSRDKNKKIVYGKSFTGTKKNLEAFLLPNRLFLSVAANSSSKILHSVYRYFQFDINVHSHMDSAQRTFHRTTLKLNKKDETYKRAIMDFLSAADLGVQDIRLEEPQQYAGKMKFLNGLPQEDIEELMEWLPLKPYLGHTVYEGLEATTETEYFDLNNEESTGTLKMYDIASEVLHSLKNGTVLIIDEFNSGLHSLLNKFIIDLYNDPELNKNNAQLLVATHDVCVLDSKNLKREQIWFCNKSEGGATEIYSLDEFDKNNFRDGAAFGKSYLDGRFKAVPNPDPYKLIKEFLHA